MSYRVIFKNTGLYHSGILDMHWGVRRYQNPDGTLTELGKQRLKAKRQAAMSKDPNKYVNPTWTKAQQKAAIKKLDIALTNPEGWVVEDLKAQKKAAELGTSMVKSLENFEKDTRPTVQPKKRMDLSNMTDQEMREKINRELIERQYNDLFNKPDPVKISKGRETVQNILAVTGTALGVTSTAVGIALALKELKSND